MLSPDILKAVAAFHETFKHPVLTAPQLPSARRMHLRYELLYEELEELKTAIENQDLVAVTDALCDLQYVLAGAVLEFGLKHKFKTLFEEVHHSNMSKACHSEAEAAATVAYYKHKGIGAYCKKINDSTFLVYRSKDDKTLKSIHYSPPQLEPLLDS